MKQTRFTATYDDGSTRSLDLSDKIKMKALFAAFFVKGKTVVKVGEGGWL